MPNANKPYYCIVLASRVSKANAEDFVKRLKKDGFDEARVLVGKTSLLKSFMAIMKARVRLIML